MPFASPHLYKEHMDLFTFFPAEGIKGIGRQIVQIAHGLYGLVDAALRWRKTLTDSRQKLGYRQSKMDPCLYVLRHQSRIEGIVAIEVDDLMTAGHSLHEEKMKQLQTLTLLDSLNKGSPI